MYMYRDSVTDRRGEISRARAVPRMVRMVPRARARGGRTFAFAKFGACLTPPPHGLRCVGSQPGTAVLQLPRSLVGSTAAPSPSVGDVVIKRRGIPVGRLVPSIFDNQCRTDGWTAATCSGGC
eukprot:COSAG02_NODE_762_length_17464_cov_12.006219_6_plen_123_part_00